MRILGRISFIVLLVVLPAFTVYSQYRISGTLRTLDDQVTGQLLANVHVEVDSGAFVAMTNTNGAYEISGVAGGSHNIRISKRGYKGFFEPAISISGNDTLNFCLPSLTQETDMGTDTVRSDHMVDLYSGSFFDPKEPVFWKQIIHLYLVNASSYDSTQANNALGFGDWNAAPAGSVAKHLKRNMYILSDSASYKNNGGVMLTFHAGNNYTNSAENLVDPGWFKKVASYVTISIVNYIQHEAAGWGLGKGVQDVFPSNMNSNADHEYTLEDVVLTWVAENHKNAKLRGEQVAHLLNMVDYSEPALPVTPRLILPLPNAILRHNLVLRWSPVFGTDYYHIQLATDSAFGALLLDDSLYTTVSKPFNLSPDSSYYFRVLARNAGWTKRVEYAGPREE